jgi:hypothetical protein
MSQRILTINVLLFGIEQLLRRNYSDQAVEAIDETCFRRHGAATSRVGGLLAALVKKVANTSRVT